MSVVTIKQAAESLEKAGYNVFDNPYVAIDDEYHSLFLTTRNSNDSKGNAAEAAVYEALRVSEPLRRAIGHTTSSSGTKSWYEKGLEYSWHYHPEIGLNLSVLTSRK